MQETYTDEAPKRALPHPVGEVMDIDKDPGPDDGEVDWRFSYLKWIVEGKLPLDKTEAHRITR